MPLKVPLSPKRLIRVRIWSSLERMHTYTQPAIGFTKALRRRATYAVGLIACGAILLTLNLELRPKVQLFILPLIYLGFWRLRLLGGRVPLVVFGAALMGVGIGLTTQLSHVGLARGAFVVAGGRQWDLNQEVKIYRDRLRRALPSYNKALVGLHSGSVATHAEAQSLLSRYPRMGGVIWGSSRWMNVALQAHAPLSLAQFPRNSVARGVLARNGWSDLQLATSVSYVGLSGGNDDVAVHFIGKLIPLWRDFPSVLAAGEDREYFDVTAQSIAQMQARWSSRAHLAVPLWMSGTRHLVKATEGIPIEGAELACALRDFELALAQFHARDNPELMAAVRNNYAIALFVKSEFSGARRELRKNAMEQLAAASRSGRRSPGVAVVVSANRKTVATRRRLNERAG